MIPSPGVLDAVDDAFAEHHAAGASPSAAWAVFDRSGPVHSGGIGTLEGGATPGPDTAYRVASCTKSFTAAALLSLRDAGLLHLDEPVTRFLPAFSAVALPSADSPVPTLRMLATMSAGFPTDNPWGDRQEAMSVDAFDGLLRRGLSFATLPGTGFAYSNLGYALLGRVIEVVSGTPYRDLITTRFLEPLRLGSTGFDTSVPAAGGIAVGSVWRDGAWQSLAFSSPGVFSPIGGLFTTVTDLARWATWLAEAFDPGSVRADDAALLSRASRREMQQLQRFAPGRGAYPTGYGLGLFVEQYPEETVISHSGGYPGFSAHMRWSAKTGLGVIAVANATGSRISAAATVAFDRLIATRQSEPVVVWDETRAAQEAVNALIRSWSDEGASSRSDDESLFSENVELDEPFWHRRTAARAALATVGGLLPDAPGDPSLETSVSPADLSWVLPGRAGRLRVEIQLTPEHPSRVQTLKVTADRL